MSLTRVFTVVAAGALISLIACGSDSSALSYELVLTRCYAPSPVPPTPDTQVSGIVTVTNNGSSTVVFEHPCVHVQTDDGVGYEVTDANGVVVSRRAATDVSALGCACSCEKDTLAPGQTTHVLIADIGWYLTTPDNPNDIGSPDPTVPLHSVAPGTYHVSALLLGGARTNAVTVTACAPSGAIAIPYAECMGPCADGALASSLNMTPVRCDAARTCSDY